MDSVFVVVVAVVLVVVFFVGLGIREHVPADGSCCGEPPARALRRESADSRLEKLDGGEGKHPCPINQA